MLWNVYVAIDDTKKVPYPKTTYSHNKENFEKINKAWRWIYCSVNDFEATQKEMDEKKVKTKRNIPFLKKINWVFADLDVAKAWDWQEQEDIDIKKMDIVKWLFEKCDPSIIIDTANWLQPIRKLKNSNTTEEYQKRYVNVINWVIEWSKTIWASWDKVKDVTRVLRVPWYNHMKWKPYMCKLLQDEDREYELEDMEKIFLDYIPKEKKVEKRTTDDTNKTQQYMAVENLDFKEVIIRAFSSMNRSCEFDKQNRLTIDGRLTGNFIWKVWTDKFIASTSHESFEWNLVTSVAEIQSVSSKEAYKWILDTFNIKSETVLKSHAIKNKIPKLEYDKVWYIYGNETFDAFDCMMSWELVTIVAESNSGKTTFAMDIIQANAKLGKKWFYINLEFPIETMREWRRLFLNNKKKRNLTDLEPLTRDEKYQKDKYVKEKLAQFDYHNAPKGMELDDIVDLIVEKQKEWYWLIVIDTFSRILWNLDSAIARTNQNKTMEILQALWQNLWIVIINLHHTNRKWTFEWSQKIMDLSNVFIIMTRDEDMDWNRMTLFDLTKDKFIGSIELETYYRKHEYSLTPPLKESPF